MVATNISISPNNQKMEKDPESVMVASNISKSPNNQKMEKDPESVMVASNISIIPNNQKMEKDPESVMVASNISISPSNQKMEKDAESVMVDSNVSKSPNNKIMEKNPEPENNAQINAQRNLSVNVNKAKKLKITGMNSPIDPPVVRRRNRLMSIENTTLTEVITIYEKLKKGRENGVFRQSKFDGNTRIDIEMCEAEDTIPIVPIFNINLDKMNSSRTLFDFNKFKNFESKKYLYFSQKTNLLQADVIENLSPNFSELLQSRNYWLNIIDPSEQDFSILFHSYGVHDLTISDIREGNTEEKIEVYKHYTFFSLRLMRENIKDKTEAEDVDFNILLFKDFVITIHDKEWPSITDILGFLNLLFTHSEDNLNPDWVLFSCFIEMSQDAKYFIDLVEPEINKIRIGSKSVEMSDVMRRNFEMELHVYSISRFIKPKIRILRQLKIKCSKRINKIVMRLLGDILEDFRDLTHDLHHFNHILERSQDTFLAVVTSDQTREANDMSKVMKRISEIALVFLPIQAVSGFFGMNCTVPFQTDTHPKTYFFWAIVGSCAILAITIFFLRTRILKH